MNTPTPKSDQEVAELIKTLRSRYADFTAEHKAADALETITQAKAGMVEELAELRQKLEDYTSKAILTMEGKLVCSPQVGMAFNDLRDERDQLRAQIHDLCHDKHVAGPVTEQEFCDGCEAFQKKLFGSSIITQLKAQLAEVTKERNSLDALLCECSLESSVPPLSAGARNQCASVNLERIESLQKKLSLSEAAASEMRRWIETPTFGELGKISDERQVEKAKILSSLAGTSFVPCSELEKADELLRELEFIKGHCHFCDDDKRYANSHSKTCKLSSYLNGKDGR